MKFHHHHRNGRWLCEEVSEVSESEFLRFRRYCWNDLVYTWVIKWTIISTPAYIQAQICFFISFPMSLTMPTSKKRLTKVSKRVKMARNNRSQQESEQKHQRHKPRKIDVLIDINTFQLNKRNLVNSTVCRNEKRSEETIISIKLKWFNRYWMNSKDDISV